MNKLSYLRINNVTWEIIIKTKKISEDKCLTKRYTNKKRMYMNNSKSLTKLIKKKKLRDLKKIKFVPV